MTLKVKSKRYSITFIIRHIIQMKYSEGIWTRCRI